MYKNESFLTGEFSRLRQKNCQGIFGGADLGPAGVLAWKEGDVVYFF